MEMLEVLLGSGLLLAGGTAAWRWMRRPRLRVYFDPANTGERPITYVMVRGNITIRRRAAWYHVQVANDGHRVASECKGRVERLEHFVDGGWARHPEFRAPIPLLWANTDGERVLDIHPEGTERLDVGCAVEGEDTFQFHHGVRPSGFVRAVPAGRYRLTVTVLSEDAKPASTSVVLDYRGDWESLGLREAE